MIQPRRKRRKVDGWIVLDKPVGMTSTAAVAKVRWLFQAEKAGHAGTLDPLAGGCLPIALGEATKTVPVVMDGRKAYAFTLQWGVETATDDREGAITATSDLRPEPAAIEAALPAFRGRIMQIPPRYSAVKVEGERAYDLAREGEVVTLEPRPVDIDRLELVATDGETATFAAECGKGAYIRALARDLGRALGTRAHVAALRRLSVGPFAESDMIPLALIEETSNKADREGSLVSLLRPVETALADIPALAVTAMEAGRLRQGQAVLIRGRDAPAFAGAAYAVAESVPVALGEVAEGAFRPKRVFKLGRRAPPARKV